MPCHCGKPAVIAALCDEHFIAYFEDKVRHTIEEFQLIPEGAHIAVGVSGGKDSLTVLVLLKKWYGDVTAIAIDEGIPGYRDKTLEKAREICSKYAIPLVIGSYKELTGVPLSDAVKHGHPCSICGTLRRSLLNKMSQGYDVLATGHNADDESQAVLMNILRGNTELFRRMGPATAAGKGFTRRVKPLYFCTEKEIMTYSFLNDLVDTFVECPYAHESYRGMIRDELNSYARDHSEVRQVILRNFLSLRGNLVEPQTRFCERCGQPASSSLCSACRTIEKISQ